MRLGRTAYALLRAGRAIREVCAANGAEPKQHAKHRMVDASPCPGEDSDHDLTDGALDFDTIRAQLTVPTEPVRMRRRMVLGSWLAGIA